MKRAVLLALTLGGCSWLLGSDPERIPKCSSNSECPSGVCMTFGVGSNNGMCMPSTKRPEAVGGMSLVSGDIVYDQQTTFGPDCILVTPMIMRAETNERRGEAVRDNSKPMCRIGECCSNPTVKIYPPCRQMSN